MRVLPPAAPKIIPRLLSGRKCSGVVESCLLCWFRIVRNFRQALSRILAFAVIGVGASLRRLCATAIVHPLHVYERSVGFASLRNFGRSFYKASMPYPQVAGSPHSAKKNRAMPVCGSGNGARLSNRACSVGFASCETLGKHYHASLRLRSLGSLHLVHRQPFVPLHLCNDSHLCRCIVQRLCVAVFMHPCITALCGCLYASLHNDFVRPLSCILARRACSVGFASCLVNRLGCHIVWQLSAADFKHPCLKLWASTITRPCVCGRWGRCVLAPTAICAVASVQ